MSGHFPRFPAPVGAGVTSTVRDARLQIVEWHRRMTDRRDACDSTQGTAQACDILQHIFCAACADAASTEDGQTQLAVNDWLQNGDRTPMGPVCLVVDEIGKCLPLARGVAARQDRFYAEMSQFAARVEVMFVGTGCDTFVRGGGYIDRPSTDPQTVSLITVAPAAEPFALLRQYLQHNQPTPVRDSLSDGRTEEPTRTEETTIIDMVDRLSATNIHLRALGTHPRLTVLFVENLSNPCAGDEQDVFSAARDRAVSVDERIGTAEIAATEKAVCCRVR
mgnify:FL=1